MADIQQQREDEKRYENEPMPNGNDDPKAFSITTQREKFLGGGGKFLAQELVPHSHKIHT